MSRRGVFRFNRTPTPPSEEENPLSRSTIGLEPTETTPNFLPFEAEPSRRTVTPETQPTPNTTETGSSYRTVTALHITEPFEHLIDEVLERRNRQNEEVNIETSSETSVFRFSPRTGRRPGLNRTGTDQDRKYDGPIRTVTAVRSSVHLYLEIMKTGERPVFSVLTGPTVKKLEIFLREMSRSFKKCMRK